jgi:Spy/CpxP family protein refolding chaperone
MNIRKAPAAALLLLLVGTAASAVPVFSSDERADGLRRGLGMGLAKPADDNGYPGPRHVLDAADELGLTPDQRQKTAELVARMQAEAIPASARLLADEDALAALFKDKEADLGNITAAVDTATHSLAAVQVIHLKYHLAMRALLTPAQLSAYATREAKRPPTSAAPPPARSETHGSMDMTHHH